MGVLKSRVGLACVAGLSLVVVVVVVVRTLLPVVVRVG
jgi:hypothetical protein